MDISIPIKTISEANRKEHWAVKAKRAKAQRNAACLLTKSWFNGRVEFTQWEYEPPKRLKITLTRIAPRELDTDNLAAALKAIRDGVTDGLGRKNDRDCLTWEYRQAKGKPKEYRVDVKIEEG